MVYQGVPDKQRSREGWATALGWACGIGIVGVLALGIGLVFALPIAIQIGFAVLTVAAVVALAGGYQFFLNHD
ncbi:hypothetical protein ASE16_03500 [Leifsonia sp. Root227]|uniref:hypothetical protein n=1 Tax=Leifsonia sp. Root227 TaxID=1736496 RepID=UPI0006F5AF0D|nr:hypothetical protein [Leifsonia sp. Root227]KRC52126.1 hypothetical protein ASE16_03500 [Leifsonia sp. Root227]